MKKVYHSLLFLHLFVGIGALAGGMFAIIFPQGPPGMLDALLKNSPFHSFLIPGVILFVVIGLGNVASAVTMHFKLKFQGYISSVFSWALVIWIVVQCIMLNTLTVLHIIYFIIGLIGAVLAAVILFKERLFPSNLILFFYKK